MGLRNSKVKHNGQSGFTIVELLIVIVVIGILAAITIVAYNGVTARANTTSAQAAASSFAKKAELYNADSGNSRYPVAETELTSASSSATYYLTGITISYSTTALTSSTTNNTVRVLKCSTAGGTTSDQQAEITASSTGNAKLSGLKVIYFDYSAGAETTTPILVGNTTNCPTAA